MDLRCPKCNSTDLKKVSLAYQEGLYRTDARTRLSAALVGGSGPDLLVGRGATRTSHQSALSKRLAPPLKWSYLRVGSWSVLVFNPDWDEALQIASIKSRPQDGGCDTALGCNLDHATP